MSDPIHTFWVGLGTMFGCNECNKAAWSEDDIDHESFCSLYEES